MARDYYLQDDQSKFVLAYGKHAVRSKVAFRETQAVGSDLQVTFRRALGIGEWDGREELYYEINESAHLIPAANYHFHPGGAADAPDAFFPTEPAHPGFAYDSIRLPVGLAVDNKPENAISIDRCLKVADYDSNGNQIGFGFSANQARVATDVIKKCRPNRYQNLIDFGALAEWRDWGLTQISATVDGQNITIPRFETHVFLVPPFSLEDALDRLCQITCSDWQWKNGKIRFMAPIDRPSEFTFDLAEVSENDFKFLPVDKKNRPNMVRIFYRDIRHPQLQEADPPVEVKRTALIAADDGIENPLEINIGVAEQSQAERVAEYWAKVRCDTPRFAKLKGSWKSYPVLPADKVKLTHDVPNWVDKDFKVIEKEEDEENGEGYEHKLQEFPSNPYSDLDHTPAVTPTVSSEPNPIDPPPEPTITLSEVTETSFDQVAQKAVKGIVDFGDFGFAQRAKIYVERPSDPGIYEEVIELSPDSNNQAQFRLESPEDGILKFKAVPYGEMSAPFVGAPTIKQITIAPTDLFADGLNVTSASERALTGLKQAGSFQGFDEDVVPQAQMSASVTKSTVVDDGANVEVRLAGDVSGAKVSQASQGDSIFFSTVEVFDKFGASKKVLTRESFNGAGTLGQDKLPRKNLDPHEEAIFRFEVENSQGTSASKYLHKGVLTDTKPATVDPDDYPRDLSSTTISSSSIRFSALYTEFGSYSLTLQKRPIGGGATDWVNHASGITSLPYDATGLEPDRKMEYRFLASSDADHFSNFVLGKTFPPPEATPSYPAPTGFDGSPDSTTPTTKLNFSFTSKGNVATKVFKNGTLDQTLTAAAVDAVKTFSLSGLSAGESVDVGIQHDYGSGNLSSLVEITRETNDPPPSTPRPVISAGVYQEFGEQVRLDFTEYGTADVVIKRSVDGAAWATIESDATSPFFDENVTRDEFADYFIDYQAIQSDATPTGSLIKPVRIPQDDPFSCFLAGTVIWMWDGTFKPIEQVVVGDYVKSFDPNGNIVKGRVIRTFIHQNVHKYAKLKFVGRDAITHLTTEHRYWLPDLRFEAIANLSSSDKIRSFVDGEWADSVIESIEEVHEQVDVYNFHVDKRVYFANGDAVHNSKA